MKKKLLTTVLASAVSMSMMIPAFAAGSPGIETVSNGTEIKAGVILNDPDVRFKVEVPTLFAFVVNGSVAANTNAVTSAGGDILLPNRIVTVTTPSGVLPALSGTATYTTSAVGSAALTFVNKSSYQPDAVGGATQPRAGQAVTIKGNIKNEGTLLSRNNWEHVSNADTLGGNVAGFKKYTVSVNGNLFDTPEDGGLSMSAPVSLPAPDLGGSGSGASIAYTNADSNGMALSANPVDAIFDVYVGGQKGQYKQVEQSAKVGTIVWTVSADISADVYTAPDNEYLDGTDSGAATDPDGI